MFVSHQLINKIIDGLVRIERSVEYRGLLNLLDAHVLAENFFAGFLNIYYGYHLHNLNKPTKNHPAIDLGDSINRIAFQITSVEDTRKIQDGVDKFIGKGKRRLYDRLCFLIIGKKQTQYKSLVIPNDFKFNIADDILDISDLVKSLTSLNTTTLQSLSHYIDEEIVDLVEYENVMAQSDRNALLEYKAVFDRPAMLDPFDYENNYTAFGIALTDLIELLNDGRIYGRCRAKPRSKFNSSIIQSELSKLFNMVRDLRVSYKRLVVSGQIDEQTNIPKFEDPKTASVFDDRRKTIVATLNLILDKENIPPIIRWTWES